MTELSFSVKISDLFRPCRHLGKMRGRAVDNGYPLVCVWPLGQLLQWFRKVAKGGAKLGFATFPRKESPPSWKLFLAITLKAFFIQAVTMNRNRGHFKKAKRRGALLRARYIYPKIST